MKINKVYANTSHKNRAEFFCDIVADGIFDTYTPDSHFRFEDAMEMRYTSEFDALPVRSRQDILRIILAHLVRESTTTNPLLTKCGHTFHVPKA